MSRSRVLVTGGAGFIGSELVRQLLAQDYHVVVVDNLANGKRDNLAALTGEQLELIVADIRNQDVISRLLPSIDIVFHLACLGVRHSIHSPIENHEVNAAGTLQLLALAHRYQVKRFVYVSSSEVYGTALRIPMTEEHPTLPMTVYGASKLAGESYTRAYFRTYGLSTVVVRPFNSYGPRSHHEGDSGEVIPKFMLRCMAEKPMVIFGDGCQTRDFTYVSDTARGILLAAMCDDAVGQTMNLGSGCEISINALADAVEKIIVANAATTVHDEARPGDVLRLFADINLAKDLLGFYPQVSLTDGLLSLYRWYQAMGKDPATLLQEEVLHNWMAGEHAATS